MTYVTDKNDNLIYISSEDKKSKDRDIKLALELSSYVHDTCKNVPHDIGLKLLEIVLKYKD